MDGGSLFWFHHPCCCDIAFHACLFHSTHVYKGGAADYFGREHQT